MVKVINYFLQVLFVCCLFVSVGAAQNLPAKINGYKLYKQKIFVKNETAQDARTDKTDGAETIVKLGEPEIFDVSVKGVTLEIRAEIYNLSENGTVDFMTFRDFRVNSLAVEIEDYRESFDFVKNQRLKLAKPVKIFLSTSQTFRGAFAEVKDSKNEWLVTGRIFVFGRFKKFGFSFKRVVPVEINLSIKNPLKTI